VRRQCSSSSLTRASRPPGTAHARRESNSGRCLLTEPSAASSGDRRAYSIALLHRMETALSRDRSSSSFSTAMSRTWRASATPVRAALQRPSLATVGGAQAGLPDVLQEAPPWSATRCAGSISRSLLQAAARTRLSGYGGAGRPRGPRYWWGSGGAVPGAQPPGATRVDLGGQAREPVINGPSPGDRINQRSSRRLRAAGPGIKDRAAVMGPRMPWADPLIPTPRSRRLGQ